MPEETTARPRARQSKPPAGLAKKAPGDGTGGFLTYQGARYKLAEETGIWPALQFARAAEAGWRTDDPRGLAAIHAFLQDIIDPDDWGRFQEDMISKKVVDLDGLLTAAQQGVEEMLARQAELAKANGSRKPKQIAAEVVPEAEE